MIESSHIILQGLGLSDHEIKVYLALLKLGDTTTGPLIDETKLHRQFVYTALKRLQERGLASYVTRRNTKTFSASHPSVLVRTEEQRLAEVKKLVPELLTLQSKTSEKLQIRVLRGREEFYNNLVSVIESAARGDKIIRIIGGAADEVFYNAVGRREKAYEAACNKGKVKKYLLAPQAMAVKFKKTFASNKNNILKLVAQGLSSPSYTRITQELVTIEIYLSDIVVVQIWSKEVAQGYLEHFNLIWGLAEPYVPSRLGGKSK